MHTVRTLLCCGLELSGRTSYRKISRSLKAAKFWFKLFQWLWNLTGTSAATLPRCLSNFRAIRSSQHPISCLRDFTRFGCKTSYRLVNINPGLLQWHWGRIGLPQCQRKLHYWQYNLNKTKYIKTVCIFIRILISQRTFCTEGFKEMDRAKCSKVNMVAVRLVQFTELTTDRTVSTSRDLDPQGPEMMIDWHIKPEIIDERKMILHVWLNVFEL